MQQAIELQAAELDDNIAEGNENDENVEELGLASDDEELGVTSEVESGNESD